jgi:hypothetical protein
MQESDKADAPAGQEAQDTPETPDPEIEALLAFEPVPRKVEVAGSWTPELQRELIARLAAHGSANRACDEMGKSRAGTNKLLLSPHGASFRAAWDGAVALAKRRKAEQVPEAEYVGPDFVAPSVDRRRKYAPSTQPLSRDGGEGEVMNEHGEWEDSESYAQRAEEAGDSIAGKLLRIRRLYLQEISACPGKRAAFEILTELPIDWARAERGEAQDDEPWHNANQRQPDMILTAESGWSFGEIGYGPDKKRALREAIDAHRAAEGKPAIDWSEGD